MLLTRFEVLGLLQLAIEVATTITPNREQANRVVSVPQTVSELIVHYEAHELHRKAFASQENHRVLINKYIKPRWGMNGCRQCARLRSRSG